MRTTTRPYRPETPHDAEPEPAEHAGPPACPGKCNTAYRAAEKRLADKGIGHDLSPRAGDPIWCRPCVTAVRGALEDWPELAQALVEEIDSGIGAAHAGYVSGSKNRPIHDHEPESLLLDEYAEWIRYWETRVRAARDLDPRTADEHPVRAIITASAFLQPHLTWLLCSTRVAGEFGLDLLGYHRKAQALTGTSEARPQRIDGVPCPQCGRTALCWEIEDSPRRRQSVQRYACDPEGQPLSLLRPLGPSGAGKVTVRSTALLAGAVTGYVRCLWCRPEFRMPPGEYERYTRQWAADPAVREAATPQLLTAVFGGSVPPQYAKPGA